MTPAVEVRAGQRWRDKDPRSNGRVVIVETTDDRYAYCRWVRRVRIRLDRLRKCFELVERAR